MAYTPPTPTTQPPTTPTGTDPTPISPAYYSPANQQKLATQQVQSEFGHPSGPAADVSAAFSSIGHGATDVATDVGAAYQKLKGYLAPQIGTTSVTPQTTAEINKLEAGKKSASTTPSSIYGGGTGENQLQGFLNKSLSPYLSQLSQSIQQQQNTNLVQPWMPNNIKAPIARFQALTNQGLPGIQKAITSASKDYVASSAANQVLNILPSSLIYHTTLAHCCPFQNQPGLQSLWQILQNTNLGLPNPAQASNSSIESYLNALTPTGTGASTSTSTGTGNTG